MLSRDLTLIIGLSHDFCATNFFDYDLIYLIISEDRSIFELIILFYSFVN